MKKIIFILLAFGTFALNASLIQAETYYVQSMKAKVMSEKSFKGKVVAEVNKGYKFSAAEKLGTWIKVSYSGKVGFVANLLVSTHPPLEKATLIKAGEGDISQGVRRRASTYTSAAAARGLTHEDRKRVSTEEELDYRALEKMEAVRLSADEVTRFMEGSNL